MVMRRSKALLPARDIERHLFSQFSGFLQNPWYQILP
jgi:hypothetical protein